MNPDRQVLTKLVSRLENGAALPAKLYAKTGRARVIGITGPPGVGKSTLIGRLIDEVRQQGKTVGVVAIDPTSPISGGALLGDRLRMQRHSDDDGVFIRSLATRNHRGGLTDSTPQIVHALDAAGFDIVIVETVGTGQDEVEVAEVADTVVVVLMPELGDEIQRAKSGLMEIADIVVINKSDLVEDCSREPARGFGLGDLRSRAGSRLQCVTSAKTGDGVASLVEAINAQYDSLVRSGELAKRRERAARAEVIRLLQSRAAATILRALESSRAQSVLTDVAQRKLDPYDAVEELSKKVLS
ncbi:MAG TPA: methylmalonyl Co-A mutase-associated GTPase MeaB [Verrucomicrobiae bacterium]|nr:methylmalonyl Co-A mutase-associated GTPase MeaB [Verrucomicrobiae bacterium]